MKIPSIHDLEALTVHEAIDYINSIEPAYVPFPKKPILKNSNFADATLYAEELKKYEEDLLKHTLNATERRILTQNLYGILEEYIKQETMFYEYIPIDKQNKVWSYAWRIEHSNGYHQFYNSLLEIVELFE